MMTNSSSQICLLYTSANIMKDLDQAVAAQAFEDRAKKIEPYINICLLYTSVRLKAFQKMEEAKDSLVKYNYLAMTLKTYLITSQLCLLYTSTFNTVGLGIAPP